MSRLACALGALSILFAAPASAHDYKSGDLHIVHPWSRATPGGARIAGGYLIIRNNGTQPDRFIGASTKAAERVEIHEMATRNGVMTMRPLPQGLAIAPGQEITLAPGGYHLMFMDIRAPLKEGDRVPVTLEFQRAGKVDVVFNIEAIGSGGGHGGHGSHEHRH